METNMLPANIDTSVIEKLNTTVISVLSVDGMKGFERAFMIAQAVSELKQALTPVYMKPIMGLQNNRLGFKTDQEQGYKEEVVKNCLIEAVLTGVQPFGNQFNIIAGNCYITKEGFGHLLANYKGLEYEIIPHLPRIKIEGDKMSAAIVMKITWSIGGRKETREIDFPIRMNRMMGADAVIGKATRKARAWLFNNLTGFEINDGDTLDVESTIVKDTHITTEELKELLEAKLEQLDKKEFDDARRIIDGNEVDSFKKLKDLLTSK